MTVATSASSGCHKAAGTPKRKPAKGTGDGRGWPDSTLSSRATSATVRAMGPTVSRVWLIGTVPLES